MENRTNDFYITEPIKKLILKFAIPSITALLVSSLYNIVDQIFIGQGIGYLGNAATNVVYPITVIAMSITLLIGDGCAAHLSICQGSQDHKNSEKSVGNAFTLMIITSLIIVAILFFTIKKKAWKKYNFNNYHTSPWLLKIGVINQNYLICFDVILFKFIKKMSKKCQKTIQYFI